MIRDQIEEMGAIIFEVSPIANLWKSDAIKIAESLYEAGYRKQSEGEWSRFQVNCSKGYGQVYYQHKDCDFNATQLFPSPYHYCPNCGAKMKGGAE